MASAALLEPVCVKVSVLAVTDGARVPLVAAVVQPEPETPNPEILCKFDSPCVEIELTFKLPVEAR